MTTRNITRSAQTALRDILVAESRWHGWNKDALPVINTLVNLLLQQHSAQQPSVWHPSITYMFPDLPAKYEEANIEAATETLTRLCDFVTKMTVQCAAIKTSATELANLHQQTTNDTESPFLYFTLEQYATLAHNVHALYEQATQERQTYIDDLNEIIQSLRGESTDIPERAFDSDAHFVRLLAWESSPGLKNAQMSVPSHTTILSLADFDELAQKEFE